MPPAAFHTKHLPRLLVNFNGCDFVLKQSDNGVANGTTLWLGGQALAMYFAFALKHQSGSVAVELGSGVGLTSLAVASLGHSVLATDTALIHDTVLLHNISANRTNLPTGSSIASAELDWCQQDALSSLPPAYLAPSLLFTADTLYSPALVTPLLRTMHALSLPSRATSYLCIERRDPVLVNAALTEAREVWKFVVARVPQKKLVQALKKGGVTDDALARGDWDDLEIWKLTHPKQL